MKLLRWFRSLLVLTGLLTVMVIGISFTSWPWVWYRALATPGDAMHIRPDVIVMMGGGGIPSESGLMRSWKTAEAAALFSHAVVMIAMPHEEDEGEIGSIERELIMRQVAPERLRREGNGRNTREQAIEVHKLLEVDGAVTSVVGLVTSPEHMKRVWYSFQKVGFQKLVAIPCWAEAIKAELTYHEAELGGPSLGGAVGGNTMLKYRFWDNLMVMIRCTRETVALWYYRALGWV